MKDELELYIKYVLAASFLNGVKCSFKRNENHVICFFFLNCPFCVFGIINGAYLLCMSLNYKGLGRKEL